MSTSAVSSSAAQAAARRSDDKAVAATAANYVVHARKIGSKDNRVEDYSPYIPPKEISPAQEVLASAGAAASLAHGRGTEADSRRPPPQKSPAATTARDSRLSKASSRAAFLAVREHGEDSLEAAGPAVGDQAGGDEYLEDDPNAKVAATSAIAGHRRSRTAESPSIGTDGYPELAQEAATISHKTVRDEEPVVDGREETLDGARIHGIAMARTRRDLYTSHPPVGIEVEEKKKEETRQAAAVSMAQQMYAVMPRAEELATADDSSVYSDRAARRAPAEEQRGPSDSAKQAVYLHTIAERRVADRLAKLDEERAAEQRYTIPSRDGRPSSRPRSSNSSRVRRWSSSEGDAASTVRRRAQRRPFQPRPVAEEDEEESMVVDEALMATAKRNTASIMEDVDQRIYVYSGKPSQAKLDEWERRSKEHRKATGGGRTTSFVTAHEESPQPDQGDPEELARQRIKPTLHEIDDRVNERRGRALTKRLDADQEKRFQQEQKRRDAETAEIERKVEKMAKKETKARKKKQKPSKDEKAAEKARKKAEKEAQKADKKDKKAKKKGEDQDANGDAARDEPNEGEGAAPAAAAPTAPTAAAPESRDQNNKETAKRSKPAQKESQEDNTQPAARDIAMAEQLESEPAPSAQEPAGKDTPGFGKRKETKTSQKEKSSASAPGNGDTGTGGGAAAEGTAATGAASTNEAATKQVEREEPRTGRKGRSTEDPGAQVSGIGQDRGQNGGEQELGYPMRQWSTSPAGKRGNEGKAKTTTTTTTRKERRFMSTFFGRPRDTSGTQGSFDSETHAARIADEDGTGIPQAEPEASAQPAERPIRPGKFQEEI